nr:MAG TPA: hypothetical protein [Caudoviricetes sp.]
MNPHFSIGQPSQWVDLYYFVTASPLWASARQQMNFEAVENLTNVF